MSLDLDYIREPLLDEEGLRPDLTPRAREVAGAWLAEQADPARIELLAELMVRTARELGKDELATFVDFEELLEPLAFSGGILEWLTVALSRPRDRLELAALSVHLVDIAEALALLVFVPELPHLSARSDRTGDAARRVGVARHLRG